MSRKERKKSSPWSSSKWRTRLNSNYFSTVIGFACTLWLSCFFFDKVVCHDSEMPNVPAALLIGWWILFLGAGTLISITDINTIHGMEPVYNGRVATRLLSLYIPEKLFKAKGYDSLSEFNAALSLLKDSLSQYITSVDDTQWFDQKSFSLIIEQVSKVETMLRAEHVVSVLLLDEGTPGRGEIVDSVVSKIYDAAEFVERITKEGRQDYEGHVTSEAKNMVNRIFPQSCKADQIVLEKHPVIEREPIWEDEEKSEGERALIWVGDSWRLAQQ